MKKRENYKNNGHLNMAWTLPLTSSVTAARSCFIFHCYFNIRSELLKLIEMDYLLGGCRKAANKINYKTASA